MEIINHSHQNTPKSQSFTQRVYLGVLLIIVGAIWIFHNFDLIGNKFFDVFFSWQMLLVAIGGYFLALKKWSAGIVITAVGLFFVITQLLGVRIPFEKIALPMIFIAAGLAVLLTRGK